MAVQGSLDSPPIIVHASRSYVLTVLIGSILFACMLLIFQRDGHSWLFAWYVGLLFFGSGIIMSIYFLIRPRRIEITPAGAYMKHPFRSVKFCWRDVENFRVIQLSNFRYSAVVGWTCRHGSNPDSGLFRGVAYGVTGLDGYFPPGWEVTAEELLAQLNAGMKRWGS